MLHHLSTIPAHDRAALRDALSPYLAPAEPGEEGAASLVGRAEGEVARDPAACFRFDDAGHATLHAAGRVFRAGRFETPRLGDLRRRAVQAREHADRPAARVTFHVLDGASPATDIGSLQATAPPGSLFQVASQFNCLESTAPSVVPVAHYLFDSTQGPRASISAFPGTLLRHYAAPAPDGSRFVQTTSGRQINLIEAACEPDVATVESGYLLAGAIRSPARLAHALEARFDDLRVGVHDDIEVVFGQDWDGAVPGAPHQTVAQVLTSTLAAGGYGRVDPSDATMARVVRQLQRAAYLGTLLAAAAHGKSHVGLTLIGGGVFGNPVATIWEAILWAVDEVAALVHRDLCVVVNGYGIGRALPAATLHEAAEARGGALVAFDARSVRVGPDPG